MDIAILGYDTEGKANYKYYKNLGHKLTICDRNEDLEMPKGISCQLGEEYLMGLDRFDLLIRTPGLHPKKILKENPTVVDKIWSGTNEFFSKSKSKNIVGVTGTKGKGTTSTIIFNILKKAGHRVHLAGNIGDPAINLINLASPEDWVVLELSNFQLIDLKYSPHIAVCLAIIPEHLDFHVDETEYFSAKQNIVNYQTNNDFVIYNSNNDISSDFAIKSKAKKIAYDAPLAKGNSKNTSGSYVKNGSIYYKENQIIQIKDISMMGWHNILNIGAAVAATYDVLNGDTEVLEKAISGAPNLEHRLEFVRLVNGINYYNDSYASAPNATIAAINALKMPSVLIIGGYDRGLSLDDLAKTIVRSDHITHAIIMGNSADRIESELLSNGYKKYSICSSKDMDEITKLATSKAKPGGNVILSPGFASFDMFKNFTKRGEHFRSAVNKLRLNKYKSFIFESYIFNPSDGTITFKYSLDNELHLEEVLTIDFKISENIDQKALDIALRHLFLMSGVSYYKMYLPNNIVIKDFNLSKQEASFFSETYQKGLRELFYINSLPLNNNVNFPHSNEPIESIIYNHSEGIMVPVGGGKDSIVTIESLLAENKEICTWSLGHKTKLEPLVKRLKTKHYTVERLIDPKVVKLSKEDAINGHIPISAIFACLGTVMCILTGNNQTVVSNEASSSESTLVIDGLEINHQYSKSLEFENNYQSLLDTIFNNKIRYYSYLRNYDELTITEIFVQDGYFNKYKDVFYSCNRAFVGSRKEPYWCGECAKCAFVSLALSNFVNREDLDELFGINPLLNHENETYFKKLIGAIDAKPFECVGTIEESKTAMKNSITLYPEIAPIYKNLL